MIGYLDVVITPLFLFLPILGKYVKTFKDKSGNNNKNKLMSLSINDIKLLEKYETIWTKIENLKKNKLANLTVFDNRYIKTKIRTYSDKVH